MPLLPRNKVTKPLGSRQPDDEPRHIGAWIKKELWELLRQTRAVLNWAVDYLGLVQVDSTDEPGVLEDKVTDSATVVWTKGGSAGARTFSANAYGAAIDDHLVKSSVTDATAVGGLVEKTDSGSNVTLTEVTVGGVKKLRIASSYSVTPLGDADPLPDGAADPGVSSYASRQDHIHPTTSLAPVVALCGSGEGPAFGDWTEGPTGTWTRDYNGALGPSGWTDYVTVATGDRVFISTNWDFDTILKDVNAGTYDVLNAGGPGVAAVVRRSTDADEDSEFVAGMSVLILDGGADWGGKTLSLINPPIDVGVTEQWWGVSSSTGSSAHQHHWDDIQPVGRATYPMPMLSVATGGKLTLGSGNFFTVDPNGFTELNMISLPTFPAFTTVPLRLIFTGALKLKHGQIADSGFAPLYLRDPTAVGGPDVGFKHSWSVADFVFAGGSWLLSSFNST